jgi:hypothetical protein
MSHLIQRLDRDGKWKTILDDLASRRADPYTLVEEIVATELTRRE